MNAHIALGFAVEIWGDVPLQSAPMTCEILVATIGTVEPASALFGAALIATFILLMKSDADVLENTAGRAPVNLSVAQECVCVRCSLQQ